MHTIHIISRSYTQWGSLLAQLNSVITPKDAVVLLAEALGAWGQWQPPHQLPVHVLHSEAADLLGTVNIGKANIAAVNIDTVIVNTVNKNTPQYDANSPDEHLAIQYIALTYLDLAELCTQAQNVVHWQ